ncbi:uncharacterized protein TNCV_3619301 [Trichonephila clavipes]|nr:uncharacterized protein TNCV_3619301 [Trichonephila clavipes]
MYQDLAAFYENPEAPNSFGSVEALHRSLKGKYSKKDLKHWLSQKDAYTLHKPVRHKFQHNRVFVSEIDRQFQADLVDMQSLAEFNKGYKYYLTCIDLFSKFAWTVPLKDNFGKSVKSGLEIILKRKCCKQMPLDLPKNPNRLTINYNKATKRVKINAVQGSRLHLENLGELLGFKRNVIIMGNMKSEFIADAWSNFSVFYVYSDLISPQIVGDTQAPLLRIVRTKGQDGETIIQYYDRPQYLPLVRHSIQTIQSELRLNSGDFVPFERDQICSCLTDYKGINFQKGYGIGGTFCRLFRAALPFIVKEGKTIGKEVLMTESRVASDVLSGENFKEDIKTRSRESGKKLAQKAIDTVQSMRKLYASFAVHHLPVYKDNLLHHLDNRNCERKFEKEAGKRKRVDLTVSSKKKKTHLSTSAENSAAPPKNSTTVPEHSAVTENSTVVPEKIILPPKESESSFSKGI